jgi:AcrR family transcriptional regulator
MRTSVTPLFTIRQTRERELVLATRALFDERGMQHAPIEEIAKAVGIARGLIYRHFSSKEELFVLTVTDYLDELHDTLTSAVAAARDPEARLRACVEAFAEFGLRYPAFLDCALSLMQRPADELRQVVSESVWWRLGQGMARCIDVLAQILREGNEAGVFATRDPDYVANVLWTQGLGVLHLARSGVGVRRHPAGVPVLFEVDRDRLVESCVTSALALAGRLPGPRAAG